MHRKHRLLILLTTGTLGALPLSAFSQDADFTGGIDNNWFEANNWTPAGVPTAASTVIVNGGFGVTALASDAGGATIAVEDVFIGRDSGGGTANSLLSEVDMAVSDDFQVGRARFTAGLSTGRFDLTNASVTFTVDDEAMVIGSSSLDIGNSANGVLSITNGSILNIEDFQVGRNFQNGGPATGEATLINGEIRGTNDGVVSDFLIGDCDSSSNATGTVRVVNGSISGFGNPGVGIDEGNGGVGSGTFTLSDSVASFDPTTRFRTALGPSSQSSANAIAVLELERSYLAAGEAILGDGTTINLTIDGPMRAADGTVGAGTYAALDFVSAEIDNTTLNVEFTFDAAEGGSFDLITLSQGNAFSGTMFDEVSVNGLGDRGWQTEIVAGTASTGEVFRITVDPLPVTGPPQGAPSLQPVPTLSQAFLVFMSLLLGLTGLAALRSQS